MANTELTIHKLNVSEKLDHTKKSHCKRETRLRFTIQQQQFYSTLRSREIV